MIFAISASSKIKIKRSQPSAAPTGGEGISGQKKPAGGRANRSFLNALNARFAAHCEFLPWARPYISEDEARAFMLRSVDEFASETGERRFFIVADEGRAIIGCIGLKPGGRNRYVVGYWANTEYSGKGLMRRRWRYCSKACLAIRFT
ncbi:GNAT family N-acetyltransferase [Pseudomonas sp. TH31]|uniref:GNAT family N-acetyltransferase n=1 Tax=Pseudomonas sp. TH31 TaxID=2796396 RepID=UPI001F5B651C|nr:GNAT family N-acetyltransferase [Pseudomonas sp. TH31]